MKTWLAFFTELSSRLSAILEFDFVYIWDDMAYKNGPLISPQMVEEFMVPYYAELIQHLKHLGYTLFMRDSDGDPRKILPSVVEAGVNAFLNCEINSGVEPGELQKEYGKKLSLCGGIDKKVLAKRESDVYEEVMRKVPDLLRHGGYVPAIDHSVPNDVPFQNYYNFTDLVRNLGREIIPELL
jgi:uroporphyrinogen decarboxylase